MMQNRPTIIGLTGGTGCGKTTICSILEKYNAVIIDADKIGHNIIKKGQQAYIPLLDFFGENILDDKKEIDRKKLGNIVFNNKEKLDYLNKITHKYIKEDILEKLKIYKNQNKYKYIVLDAPLLIETNLHKNVDTIWIVYAKIEDRLARLKNRDNLPEEVLIKRISNQTSFEKNKQFADFIIFNENINNLEELIKEKIKEL